MIWCCGFLNDESLLFREHPFPSPPLLTPLEPTLQELPYKQALRICHLQEEKRKERTHAFAADGHPIEYAHPSDQVLPEEFAESAKGLAGMDCFELYGGTRTAPALRVTNARDANIEREAADDANAYALASCLNTPYTGEVSLLLTLLLGWQNAII